MEVDQQQPPATKTDSEPPNTTAAAPAAAADEKSLQQIATNPASSESEITIVDNSQPMEAEKHVVEHPEGVESAPPELEMREEINSSPTPEEQEDLQKNGHITKPVVVVEEEAADHEPIKTHEEMKKVILTQSQLKRLGTEFDASTIRELVVGCFVRVNIPGLPQAYSDRIFIDQIVDVLEPQSYQHLWLNRRFRLRNLGDFEAEKVVGLKVQHENELRPWFDYMEAKDEPLPTHGFVKQKSAALDAEFKALDAKEKAAADEAGGRAMPAKVSIKRENLAQIALNPVMLRNLAKLDYDRFRQTVVGCFVCMQAIRKDKPKDCQYHIVRVLDCVRGRHQYKVRNVALVNYQLVLPHYGKYILNWVKSFTIVTESGFHHWVEDMRQWKEPIPTLDQIRDKATQLQLALNEAEKIPTMMEVEKQRQEQEERAKRALLPVETAKDLDACCLTRQQLQKLAELPELEQLAAVLTGCFVRVNAGGAANNYEIDQILGVEEKKKGGQKVLELKFAGTISLTALTYIASTLRLGNDQEFKEYVKKLAAAEEESTLPTYEFVDRKQAEVQEALKSLATGEEPAAETQEQQKSKEADNNKNAGPSAATESPTKVQSSSASTYGKPPAAAMEKTSAANGNGAGAAESSSSAAAANASPVKREPRPYISVPVKDGQLTVKEFRNILVSMKKVTDLMTCEKEVVVRVLRGYYARIAYKRKEKPSNQQYIVDQITGVSWGGEPYRIRAGLLTDLRLHCKHVGQQPLSQLFRAQGDNFSDDAFQLFLDDMKKWRNELPSLAQIEKKTREYRVATANAKKLPRSVVNSGGARQAFMGGGRQQQHQGSLLLQSSPPFEQIQQHIQKQLVSSVRSTPGLRPGWMNSPSALVLQQQQQQFVEQQPIGGNWQHQTAAFISSSAVASAAKRPLPVDERESWRIQQQQQQQRGGGGGGMSRDYEQMQQPRYSSDDRFVGSSAFPAAASQPTAMMMDYRGGSRGGTADVESLMNVRDFPALLQSRSPPPVPPVYQQERSPYDYRRGGGGATGYEMMEQQHGGYSASPAAAYRQRDEMIPQLKQFGSGGSSAASTAYNNSYGNSNNNSYGGGGPSRPKRARGMSPQAPPVERFF